MNWIELSVEIDPEAVEAVSELFARVGYNGGVVVEQSLIPREDEPSTWEELAPPAIDPSRPVSVRAYIPDDDEAGRKREETEKALWALSMMRQVGELKTRPCKEEDWENAWKAYYAIQRIGERTVIKPSWLEYTPREGDVVLDLDPGMAFGTGLHPTTRLCLIALEKHAPPLPQLKTQNSSRSAHKLKTAKQVLDLGTGSGILAISAAKLGGPDMRVLALDTDMVAVEAARENVERNGLSEQIEVGRGSTGEAEHDAPFDLIVANILATTIIDLSHSLHKLLAPSGTLVTSGIFVDRGDAVVEALARAGLPVTERHQEGDWLCLVSERER